MRKRAIFIFIIILIILFGVFFYIGLKVDKLDNQNLLGSINNLQIKEEKVESENLIETTTFEEKTTPNTILTLQKYYIECGHTIETSNSLPEEEVNLTEDEIREKYADWNLELFSMEEIILLKEVDSFCGEHYLVTEKDGFIAISTVDQDGTVTFKEKTNISVEYLPETDRITLKNGLMVYGTEELNKLLEDYE